MTVGRVVVMGAAGSGKSTLAGQLASRWGVALVEADELHSATSIEKMGAGVPLGDDDRWPWLAAVRRAMREQRDVVVACSALRRSYRDALRRAGNVRFVHLDVAPEELRRRLEERPAHYMSARMLDSQLAVLEPLEPDESDAVVVDGGKDEATVAARAMDALAGVAPGTASRPLLAVGAVDRVIASSELGEKVEELAAREVLDSGARRVLLVPPDHTRLKSRAGEITARLHDVLTSAGCEVAVLPAVGTHAPMNDAERRLLFGEGIPDEHFLEHRWRDRMVHLGTIDSDEIAAASSGLVRRDVPVEVSDTLVAEWDLVVSIGQVVPHEVIGMANFTKNLVIGLGGGHVIETSHFLSAIAGLESIMGRAQTPVRDIVDAAFDRFLAPRVPVLWILTVTEDSSEGVVQRGLFAGRGGSGESGGAAFTAAAKLAACSNIRRLAEPQERIVCWLGADEYRTTWVGNKAVYRTRMAVADGGEIVVLAPGVERFSSEPSFDRLIRRHGYRGTQAVVRAMDDDDELAAGLAAAAHLIHGSSEERFAITYCIAAGNGRLTHDDLEAVGYRSRPLEEEARHLGVDSATPEGPRRDADGVPFYLVANPGLGLWSARDLSD